MDFLNHRISFWQTLAIFLACAFVMAMVAFVVMIGLAVYGFTLFH